jgi:hypothetical protein
MASLFVLLLFTPVVLTWVNARSEVKATPDITNLIGAFMKV